MVKKEQRAMLMKTLKMIVGVLMVLSEPVAKAVQNVDLV